MPMHLIVVGEQTRHQRRWRARAHRAAATVSFARDLDAAAVHLGGRGGELLLVLETGSVLVAETRSWQNLMRLGRARGAQLCLQSRSPKMRVRARLLERESGMPIVQPCELEAWLEPARRQERRKGPSLRYSLLAGISAIAASE